MEQIIVIVPPALPPAYHYLLFLLLRHCTQKLFQLILGDLLLYLTRACQRDEAILNIRSPRFLDKTYAAQTIGCFWEEYLRENRLAGIRW